MTTMRARSLTLGLLISLFPSPGRSQDAWREIRYRESSQSFRTRSVASTRRA